MTIPAIRHKPALFALVIASLSACSAETMDGAETPDISSASQADNCLVAVWEAQRDPDQGFDRAHDTVEGGAISCATGTSATEYAAAIDDIRRAADREDRAGLLANTHSEVLYLDAVGEPRTLNGQAAIVQAYADVFDRDMMVLMRNLRLSDMAVETGSGGYFALGALWLAPDGPGGRPRIVTINRQALGESLAMAQNPATPPLPDKSSPSTGVTP